VPSHCSCGHEDSDGRDDVLDCVVHGIASYPDRNDSPEHIAAVAKMAEVRGCDWPGYPCGRGIPEFNGRDAECICETLVTRSGG
jgi:hypothetical protein